MGKHAILFLVCIVLCTATKWYELHSYTFERYVEEFQRSYSYKESVTRKQIFETRLRQIIQHNSDPTKTWKQGVNQFTDQTEEEFRQLLGGRKELINRPRTVPLQKQEYNLTGADVDWRQKGIISPVKDQGRCGSCWTFASTETLESYWAQSTGELVHLSEQQILDCTPNPNQCGGTGGCGGGTAELAYDKIKELGGIATEWTYPYVSYAGDSQKCSFKDVNVFAKVSGYVNLPSNEYAPLVDHLTTKGPLAVNVDALTWHSYESGVFDGCNQKNPDINHVVQLVGYGTDPKDGQYWLVRNSWSPAWGEQGYIRLKINTTPACGTDLVPGDGTGCNGGPSQVTVCGTCGILYDAVYPVVSK